MKITDNRWLRNSFVWIIIMAAVLLLFFVFINRSPSAQPIAISQVVQDVNKGIVTKIEVHEDSSEIKVCYDPATTCHDYKTSLKEPQDSIYDVLQRAGVSADKLNGSAHNSPIIQVEPAQAWGNY